ncbi:alpha/beta-Hydrolases superfamily protein [Perilla frutescens var. hirtella]|uniref:Alpha/beta-Hydrolases superfamily protein n=1 Tax=Perilla frutescens var. hirtella TaxID=608512 RepID=A0AAD4IXW2_PERFH|nr:alpha/beta-Hydrolases superfamily protein [Perilla frutescens var. hirtella]
MSNSTCNKSFCSNYMLLNPEDAGFADVVKILFSGDISKRKFIDCSDGTHEPLGRRWIIFISILAQKFLQAAAKPLAGFGYGVEYWLNLLSANGGFCGLITNSFKGKIVELDSTSASFRSFLGHVDKRLELDPTIGSGDERYYAALSVMASKASYENKECVESIVKDHWKMDFVGFYDFHNDYQGKATTQAFIMDDKKDTIIVAFRGTEPFDADAWSSDVDLSWYEINSEIGKIHGGFLKALGLLQSQGWPLEQDPNQPETAYYAIRKLLTQLVQKNPNAKFIVTGHSLGGALAVLFPAVLGLHKEYSFLLDRLEGVYTFGQPRVGDGIFGEYMNKLIEKHSFTCIRFVYSYDLVPRLPYDDSTLLFKHFGTCIYYNSLYQGKVVDEEPDKNYFSIIWMIPKFLNAGWELIRSFCIKYMKGSDYEEGGLLRMFRVIGLMVAGVSAHCTQDYVNCMRLGSSDVFLSLNGQKMLKMQ